MKGIKKLLVYLIPYWKDALFNLIFNLLAISFSIFSVAMAIPFLGILFNNQPIVANQEAWNLSYSTLEHNFNYFLSQVILQNDKATALLYISLLVVSMTFFKTLFTYLANYVTANLRNGIVKDVRNQLFDKVLKLPLSYFSDEKKGDLMSRMTNDVNEIESSIIRSLNAIFKDPISILFYLATLLFMSAKLTLFVFVLLPFTGVIIAKIASKLREKSAEAQSRMGTLLSQIEETLSGLRIIKAFNSENRVQDKFLNENHLYTRVMVKMWRRRDLASPLSELLGTIVIVTIMWYGGSLILNGDGALSSQSFMGYLMIFYLIINPTKSFTSAFYNVQKGMASVDRINKILNAKESIIEKENAIKINSFDNKIEYKDLQFAYEEETVLQNINITIEKGKTIALVGQSGSGKSTLVDLLPRFYDYKTGKILIDGKEIKELKIKSLRNLFGIVNQESILFNDTIYNNIAFGVENAKEEDIIQAAQIANAHDFITATPESYQTNIGDRGNKLSGGQKQRISIARAILKNPPILILDEATSALDTESEKLVQDALNNLMKNRTSIVIAHRLSTVKDADEIIVLHEGKIVERGKHEELLSLSGFYAKLHKLQMFE